MSAPSDALPRCGLGASGERPYLRYQQKGPAMSDLSTHLAHEHKIGKVQEFLRQIVFGGNDGIVTTFAVVAGFTGAKSGSLAEFSIMTVLLFGLANLFADGSAMGLGNFLSIRAQKEV